MIRLPRLSLGALVILISLSAGCFGGPSIQKIYYSLQSPSAASVHKSRERFPVDIVVRPFSSDIAYRRQEIVYRSNPYQFSYYNFRLWAARPDKMLRQLITTHLRRVGLFDEVTDRLRDDLPDYELRGEVLAIEELDSTEEQWFGRLALRLLLIRFSDRKTVWEHSFDVKQRVAKRDPVYVVETISRLLATELDKAVVELSARLLALGHAPSEVRQTQDSANPQPGELGPPTAPEVRPPPPRKRPRVRLIR